MRTSKHLTNHQAANDPAFLSQLVGSVRQDGYAFQPPPNNAPERSLSVPIAIDGRFEAALLMMYIPRALKSATVLHDYLPLLNTLAERIGARAGHHGDLEEDTAPLLDLDLPQTVLASVETWFGFDGRSPPHQLLCEVGSP